MADPNVNGKVKSCSTDASGAHTVTVTFPPPDGGDKTYDQVTDAMYADFKSALPPSALMVDVAGAPPLCTKVTLHA